MRTLLLVAILVWAGFGAVYGCAGSRLARASREETRRQMDEVFEALQTQGFMGARCRVEDNKMHIETHINDKPADFILDTGASSTFLNKKHLPRLDLKTVSGADDQAASIFTFLGTLSEYDRTVAREFSVAGFTFRPWPFIVHGAPDKYGVLGVDFLNFGCAVVFCGYGVVFLDVDHQPAQDIGEQLRAFGYTEVELLMPRLKASRAIKWRMAGGEQALESGVFSIKVSVDGADGIIMLDTGAPVTTLDMGVVESTDKRVRRHKHIKIRDGAGHTTGFAGAYIDSLMVGEYALCRNQYVGVVEGIRKRGNTGVYDLPFLGVIGIELLVANHAIIDCGNRRLYLRR